jgi:hypothetical protein
MSISDVLEGQKQMQAQLSSIATAVSQLQQLKQAVPAESIQPEYKVAPATAQPIQEEVPATAEPVPATAEPVPATAEPVPATADPMKFMPNMISHLSTQEANEMYEKSQRERQKRMEDSEQAQRGGRRTKKGRKMKLRKTYRKANRKTTR